MARLVYGLNQSLDGYVDVDRMAVTPGPVLFCHFIERVRGVAGALYGRRLYEAMRYWDEDRPEWGAPERDYAQAWRAMPKWVVSRTLTAVGPNATLVEGDLGAAACALKDAHEGEIDTCGPELAHSLTQLGLVDEYRMYLHPVVLGSGKPFFAGPRPPLRLVGNERIGEAVILLRYVPA